MNPGQVYSDTLKASPAPYPGILLEFMKMQDGTYVLKLYKDNLSSFSTPKQQEIMNWVDNFVRRLTKKGFPTQYWLAV